MKIQHSTRFVLNCRDYLVIRYKYYLERLSAGEEKKYECPVSENT